MIYTIVVRDKNNTITNLISFDAVTDFSRSLSASVVKTPVENGFPITDHITNENQKFDISAVVTNFSIFNENLELRWDGTRFVSSSDDPNRMRHIDVEKEIMSLINNRQFFTLLRTKSNSHINNPQQRYDQLLHTEVEEIQNCLCSSMSFTESSGVDDAIFVKMQIEQVRIAYVGSRELKENELSPALVVKKATAKATGNGANSVSSGQSTKDKSETGATTDKQAEKVAETLKNPFEQMNKSSSDANAAALREGQKKIYHIEDLLNETKARLGSSLEVSK